MECYVISVRTIATEGAGNGIWLFCATREHNTVVLASSESRYHLWVDSILVNPTYYLGGAYGEKEARMPCRT